MFGRGYRGKVVGTMRAFDGLVEGNEFQAVIFKAHRKLAANLARYGYKRHDWETIRLFFRMLQVALPVDRRALWDFCKKLEEARYSDRMMGQQDLYSAVNALRAIQYSLEKVILTLEQLRKIQDSQVEELDAARVAAEPAEDLWVIAPHVAKWSVLEPGRKYRFVVFPRDKNKEALLREFGSKNMAGGTALPAGDVAGLRKLLDAGDFPHLGSRLNELSGRDGRRVHISSALASYLLEFQQRAQEAGSSRTSPSIGQLLPILRAAQVLSMAEGRDFMVPDDLKLAMLSVGPQACHMSDRDVRFLLDEEMREIEAPRGFLAPEPVHMQGLKVPFV